MAEAAGRLREGLGPVGTKWWGASPWCCPVLEGSGPLLEVCKPLGFLHIRLGCYNFTLTEMSLLCLNHSQTFRNVIRGFIRQIADVKKWQDTRFQFLMLSCKTENIKPAEQMKIFIYMRSVIKKILLVNKKREELTNELKENWLKGTTSSNWNILCRKKPALLYKFLI